MLDSNYWDGMTPQICFKNTDQAKSISDFLESKKYTSVLSIFASDCSYCADLNRSIKKSLIKTKINLTEIPFIEYNFETNKLFKKLNKKISQTEVIILPNHELTSSKIVNLIKEKTDFKGVFVGGDSWTTLSMRVFKKSTHFKEIEAYITMHWHESINDKKSVHFKNKIKKLLKGSFPISSMVLSYDSANLVYKTISDCYKSNSKNELLTCFKNIKSYEGVSGLIHFKSNKNKRIKKVHLIKLKNGIFTQVKN